MLAYFVLKVFDQLGIKCNFMKEKDGYAQFYRC